MTRELCDKLRAWRRQSTRRTEPDRAGPGSARRGRLDRRVGSGRAGWARPAVSGRVEWGEGGLTIALYYSRAAAATAARVCLASDGERTALQPASACPDADSDGSFDGGALAAASRVWMLAGVRCGAAGVVAAACLCRHDRNRFAPWRALRHRFVPAHERTRFRVCRHATRRTHGRVT